MLIVNGYTLKAINLLDFIDDVCSEILDTFQAQNIVCRERSITNRFTLLNLFTVKHTNGAPFRNQGFYWIAVGRRNHQTTLTLGFFTETDRASGFRKDRRLFGLSCLEEIRNTRQTTCDITRLGPFLRNPRDDVTYADVRVIFKVEDSVARHVVISRHIGTRQVDLVFTIHQPYSGTQVLRCTWPILRVEHRDVGQAGQFVRLAINRKTFFHFSKLHRTRNFRDDRVRVGVPLSNNLSRLNLGLVGDRNDSAIGQFVTLALTAMVIGHSNLT